MPRPAPALMPGSVSRSLDPRPSPGGEPPDESLPRRAIAGWALLTFPPALACGGLAAAGGGALLALAGRLRRRPPPPAVPRRGAARLAQPDGGEDRLIDPAICEYLAREGSEDKDYNEKDRRDEKSGASSFERGTKLLPKWPLIRTGDAVHPARMQRRPLPIRGYLGCSKFVPGKSLPGSNQSR
jgi:hypothetical protein